MRHGASEAGSPCEQAPMAPARGSRRQVAIYHYVRCRPMQTRLGFPLVDCGPLSCAALAKGFTTFEDFAEFVRGLPYGRTSNAIDVLTVLAEGRGTCSAKHRLLAAVAHECRHPEVRLTVGIYEMREENTPGVGAVLDRASVTSIPEAHCYLAVEGERFDFTGLPSGLKSPFDYLIEEYCVEPANLPEVKEHHHRKALAAWAVRAGRTESSAWNLREACIAALTANSSIGRSPARLTARSKRTQIEAGRPGVNPPCS